MKTRKNRPAILAPFERRFPETAMPTVKIGDVAVSAVLDKLDFGKPLGGPGGWALD